MKRNPEIGYTKQRSRLDRDVAATGKPPTLETRFFDKPVRYARAVDLQEELVGKRLADAVPDTMLLLQHSPVVTLGVSASQDNLLLPEKTLAGMGIEVVHSTRGGDITYHGPGQLVAYPVLKLREHERDVRDYVYRLEEAAILTAAAFGIDARRRNGMTGVWTDAGKLAAIGVRVRRWVTFHGVSFNVDPVPDGFKFIVPCGLTGEPVTSLRKLLAPAVPPEVEEVREAWLRAFTDVFQRHCL